MEAHYYNVNLNWTGTRKGLICSPELNLDSQEENCIQIATPPEFPKGIPGVWSPEHLFTAAINSCLMTTFLAIADNSSLSVCSFKCSARGKLDRVNGKMSMTEVALSPHITVKNESDIEKAVKILNKAEGNCLITNSVNAVVTVNPVVEVFSGLESECLNV